VRGREGAHLGSKTSGISVGLLLPSARVTMPVALVPPKWLVDTTGTWISTPYDCGAGHNGKY
jgi:hypothetical protein